MAVLSKNSISKIAFLRLAPNALLKIDTSLKKAINCTYGI
jgi:hypothetical protein